MKVDAVRTGRVLAGHGLRKVLGLRDLIPMQVLLVLGMSSTGIAARQGGSQVVFWLGGAALLFLPVAIVVQYCVRIWPQEGGVYQWTKHAFGPCAGFISAWNLVAWVLLTESTMGLQAANGLSFALGPRSAWIAESRTVIFAFNVVLFGFIFFVSAVGLRFGRWFSHFGTAAGAFVAVLLVLLLFFHPHATALQPHVSPQAAFSLQLPAMTFLSLNLFSKITFNGFTSLEQVAVFAGETRHAARSILRSAWIAAPLIAVAYVLMTGSVLTYISAGDVDLVNPVAQTIAAAFAGGSTAVDGIDWGAILAQAAIGALILAAVAQAAVYIAEASRLPMVEAWDNIIPPWFTRLHPRYGTPTRSLCVIVLAAVVLSVLASFGAGSAEAFQLLVASGFVCYGINYLMMFAVPLLANTRFCRCSELKPSVLVRAACACGAAATALSMTFNLIPIIALDIPWHFAIKVACTVVGINLLGAMIFLRGVRGRTRPADSPVADEGLPGLSV